MPIELQRDVSLRPYNSFGIDARATWFARIRSLADLQQLDESPGLDGLPRFLLGGGSNVLFTRDVEGVVARIEIPGHRELGVVDDAWRIEVGAGENWHATVARLVRDDRPGLENLALIPGLVGAAPIQNIGAYGLELAERLAAVTAWDPASRRVVTLDASECGFGYRDSVFKRAGQGGRAIVGITLSLPRAWEPATGYAEVAQELKARGIGRPTARELFDCIVAIRRRKLPDPQVIGNAGSFFKNPIVSREKRSALIERHPSLVSYALAGGRYKLAAGWLIEACGMKGVTRGRAGVFERQALVLVNRGGAAGAEILQLANEIQDKVRARFGIELEPEPTIV
ncbi:MAG TPA: UDP-N-acetylmuramate dehydrogenase [Burkholderiaceae bacterium]|nr:UDP-N-acetylmuramate dehydrogenase [Burkholderiaceae bacterium]